MNSNSKYCINYLTVKTKLEFKVTGTAKQTHTASCQLRFSANVLKSCQWDFSNFFFKSHNKLNTTQIEKKNICCFLNSFLR